ncbi:MAG: SCO7613 C-terminal domain-containing membrane protein, partial [Acidimicrobiales bacterium]
TVVWAAVAGLAPALGAAAGSVLGGAGVILGMGTLTDLGLMGTAQQAVALVSGVLAAYVLARQAGARRDLRLAFLALASVLVGLGTSAVATEISGGMGLLGLAGLFVVIEIGALVFFDDDFWGRPLASVAWFAEVLARIGTGVAALLLVFAPLIDTLGASDAESQRDVTSAGALLLVALGWLTADMRRAVPVTTGWGLGLGRALVRGGAWAEGTIWCAIAAAAAVEIGTMASVPTAVAMVAVSALALASRRAAAIGVAVVGVPFAVLTVTLHPLAAPLIGIAGGVVLASAARSRAHVGLAVEATVVATGAAFLAGNGWLPMPASVALAAAVGWAIATVLGDRLGDVARAALLVPLAVAWGLSPVDAVGPLVAVAALYTLDAFRLRRPVIAFGTAAAVQPLAVALAQAAGFPLPWAGFAVAVCAVVWCGLAFIVDDDWRPPFIAAAATGLAVGLVLAWEDGQALSDTLLLFGGTAIAVGIAVRRHVLGHLGGLLVLAGLFGHLSIAGISASEPYVLPVALQLVVAGWSVRRKAATPVSSWIAYVPAVALAGAAAAIERVQGGPGWHALIAGAIGVLAVAVGGWRRLSGPMVAGTVLLVVVSVRESLSTLAGVPTWAWLGLGGTVLLAVAVILERTDTSPIEAGRRVVEVMSERFS